MGRGEDRWAGRRALISLALDQPTRDRLEYERRVGRRHPVPTAAAPAAVVLVRLVAVAVAMIVIATGLIVAVPCSVCAAVGLWFDDPSAAPAAAVAATAGAAAVLAAVLAAAPSTWSRRRRHRRQPPHGSVAEWN